MEENAVDFDVSQLNISLYIFSATVILFIFIGALSDIKRHAAFMKCFVCLLATDILMQLGEMGIWLFEHNPRMTVVLNICSVMSFGFGYIMAALYGYCLIDFIGSKNGEKISSTPARIMAVLCGIMVGCSVISIWNGMFFYITKSGDFTEGPLYNFTRIFDKICIVFEGLLVIRHCKKLGLKDVVLLLSFSVLPILGMTLQMYWDPTPQYLATTLSLVIIYVLFHSEITSRLAKAEISLAQSRIAIMLSQIQPHFLYNVISSIQELCGTDPHKAREALGDFAEYLRGNVDSLADTAPIHFTREMAHVENYLKLEKMRFGDELNIVFDINERDFFLPSLTIQPLVENAVKHGIGEKENGGTLRISTRRENPFIIVEICDDGIGFDLENSDFSNGKKSHIGIANVRTRLGQLPGCSLDIESSPGSGTKVTIRINTEKGHSKK